MGSGWEEEMSLLQHSFGDGRPCCQQGCGEGTPAPGCPASDPLPSLLSLAQRTFPMMDVWVGKEGGAGWEAG